MLIYLTHTCSGNEQPKKKRGRIAKPKATTAAPATSDATANEKSGAPVVESKGSSSNETEKANDTDGGDGAQLQKEAEEAAATTA